MPHVYLTDDDHRIMCRMSIKAQARYLAADRRDAFKMESAARIRAYMGLRCAQLSIAASLARPLADMRKRWAEG